MPAASLAHPLGSPHASCFSRHAKPSVQRRCVSNMSLFSLLWQRDALSLQELLDSELPHNGRSVLVRIQCVKDQCECALNNQDVLLLKPVYDLKLVSGVWNKFKSSGVTGRPNASSTDKNIKVILTSLSTAWFEVLNESGQSIPYWTQVRDVAKHRPASFLLRKDIKCIFAKNKTGNGSFDLNAESTGILKSGTSLTFLENARYRVMKSRRIKELTLVKCSDNNGHLVFLNPDDKCAISPIAGAENISGVHSLTSIVSKFQFPLSVRPIFGPPLPWLSFSDRYHLRLTSCFRGHLLFLASLSNPERFYVVTPEMLEDHIFRLGDSELQHHTQLLEKHSTRVVQFLQSYHPFEALRYLIRHLSDTTNQMAPLERYPLPDSSRPEDADNLFEEVEDIYFYVRTGRMPTPSAHHPHQTQTSKSSSNDSGLVLVNPRSRQVEALGVPSSRTQRAASCENLLERKPPPLPPRKYNSPVVRSHAAGRSQENGNKQSVESLTRQSTDSSSGTPQHRSSGRQLVMSLYTSTQNAYL